MAANTTSFQNHPGQPEGARREDADEFLVSPLRREAGVEHPDHERQQQEHAEPADPVQDRRPSGDRKTIGNELGDVDVAIDGLSLQRLFFERSDHVDLDWTWVPSSPSSLLQRNRLYRARLPRPGKWPCKSRSGPSLAKPDDRRPLLAPRTFPSSENQMKPPVRVAVTGAAGQIGMPCCFASPRARCSARISRSSCSCSRSPTKGAEGAEGRDHGARRLRLPAARGHARTATRSGLQGRRLGAAGRLEAARARHGAQDLLKDNGKIFIGAGQGAERSRQPQRESARRRQPGQHQRLHRHEKRARPAAQELHRDAAPRPQPRRQPARGQDGQAGGLDREVAVWGNHSPTMYADYRFAKIDGKPVKAMINDEAWNTRPSCQRSASAARRSSRRAASRRRPRRPTRRSTTCATGRSARTASG